MQEVSHKADYTIENKSDSQKAVENKKTAEQSMAQAIKQAAIEAAKQQQWKSKKHRTQYTPQDKCT